MGRGVHSCGAGRSLVWGGALTRVRKSAAGDRDQPWAAVEAREAVPGEVDEVRGDLVLLELATVEPPLTGEGHHPDEHLRVDRCRLRVEPALLELGGEQVLDLHCDVPEDARERPRRLSG